MSEVCSGVNFGPDYILPLSTVLYHEVNIDMVQLQQPMFGFFLCDSSFFSLGNFVCFMLFHPRISKVCGLYNRQTDKMVVSSHHIALLVP